MGTVTSLPRARDGRVFWGEMAPCEHVVQIYADDRVLLDSLEGFVGNGLRAGEATIVIATAAHLHGLEVRLRDNGVDLEAARAQKRFITRLADDALAQFMADDWPDETLFLRVMQEMTDLARGCEGEGRRKVRVFGEMVAILWARGNHAATIHLEILWSRVVAAERFPLFCAYPRDTFARNANESIVDICRLHSRVAS